MIKQVRIMLKNGIPIIITEPELKIYVQRSKDGYLRVTVINDDNIGTVLMEIAPGEWISWESE